MARSSFLVLAVLLTSACAASSKHVDAVDTRVRALGDAEAQRAAATEARLAAIEARLDSIAEALGARHAAAVSEQTAKIDALSEKLDAMDERLRRDRPAPAPARQGPDPAVVYAVPVDDSPQEGPAAAPVTMVIGMEFACPYCEKVRVTLDELRTRYGKKLRIVHKHFIVHPQVATDAALAACAAHRQKRFKEMHDLLWEKVFAPRQFEAAHIRDLARDLGLDMARYDADVGGRTCRDVIERDQRELSAVGMRGTPGFFINGRFIGGAQPVESFAALIDAELAKAEAAQKRGIKAARYYDTIVRDGKQRLDPPAAD